jgi:hypothetical protein
MHAARARALAHDLKPVHAASRCSRHKGLKPLEERERRIKPRGMNVLPPGSRVQVISDGPFWGCKGTIHTVNTISADCDQPFCFYLIALQGAYLREPVWFEYHEVEHVPSPMVMLQAR